MSQKIFNNIKEYMKFINNYDGELIIKRCGCFDKKTNEMVAKFDADYNPNLKEYIAYYSDYHSHIWRNVFKANSDEEAIKIFKKDSYYNDDELYRIEGEEQIKIA